MKEESVHMDLGGHGSQTFAQLAWKRGCVCASRRLEVQLTCAWLPD